MKSVTNIAETNEKDSSSSVTKVINALKLTPKGKLNYDRDPKSPPPLVPKLKIVKDENDCSLSIRSQSSPTRALKQHDSIQVTENIKEDIKINCDRKNISNEIHNTLLSHTHTATMKADTAQSSLLSPLQIQHSHNVSNILDPLHITETDVLSEENDHADQELCQKLRKLWSVNDKEAMVVLERVSLLKMESMRKKGEQVDNALTAMEIKRKFHVKERLAEKEQEMIRKSEIFQKEVMDTFHKNIELYHQKEKSFREEEERQTLELQRQLDADRERQKEIDRLSKQQRHERLQHELKIVAEQQLLQRKEQEEEARLLQEAESNRRAVEEQIKKLEERRREAIRLATQAYSLYEDVRPGRDDLLSKEDGENYLRNALNLSLDSVNTTMLTDAMTRLASANEIQVIEEEVSQLEGMSSVFLNAINALTTARNAAKEKKLLEKKLSDKLAQENVTKEMSPTIGVQLKETPHEIANQSQLNIPAKQQKQSSPANLHRYSSAKAFQMSFAEKIQTLEHDKGSQIKFAIQKKVNTPVNAIAATSSEHMKDKLVKLRQLLDGNLNLQGISDVALVCNYAKNLLAAKFVKQGEIEVSNKRVTDEGFQGFAYAAIITGNFTPNCCFKMVVSKYFLYQAKSL